VRGLALALVLTLAGCGGSDGLVVAAASSLRTAFTGYGERFDARLGFAGSDELAAQIRQGVQPDVYAAANTELPQALFEEGLVERPVVFAGNRLVLAVPAGSPVRSLADAAEPGRTVVLGSEAVPVGAYTRRVLDRAPEGRAILANVRSAEPDVSGIVGKLTQGAADAGFVYATDVAAAAGLRSIALPDELRPEVRYGAAVVKGAEHPRRARAFVEGLRAPEGREALRRAGFETP
jgi:molybdate transport system substrate-binding protein